MKEGWKDHPLSHMKASNDCLKLIEYFEGMRLEAYRCPAGIWTIGIGSTRYVDGSHVKKGDKLTLEQARTLFRDTLRLYESSVRNSIQGIVTQNQYDAMVSLCYNIGPGNFHASSLRKAVNKNPSDPGIPALFEMWVYASGEVLPGLVRRRKSEAYLYTTSELKYDFET